MFTDSVGLGEERSIRGTVNPTSGKRTSGGEGGLTLKGGMSHISGSAGGEAGERREEGGRQHGSFSLGQGKRTEEGERKMKSQGS